jgi:hypothetical protein
MASKAALVAQIIDVVAEHYGVTATQIRGRRQNAVDIWARHVTLSLAVEFTTEANSTIGRLFEVDPTTVRHARLRVAEQIASNPKVASDLATLRSRIEAVAPQTKNRHETALERYQRGIREVGAENLTDPERQLDLMLRDLRRRLLAALRLDPVAVLAALKGVAIDLSSKEDPHG